MHIYQFDPGKFTVTSWHVNAVTLLAICEGNPPIAGGFPSQRTSNAELWFFVVVSIINLYTGTNDPIRRLR